MGRWVTCTSFRKPSSTIKAPKSICLKESASTEGRLTCKSKSGFEVLTCLLASTLSGKIVPIRQVILCFTTYLIYGNADLQEMLMNFPRSHLHLCCSLESSESSSYKSVSLWKDSCSQALRYCQRTCPITQISGFCPCTTFYHSL